MAVTKFSHSNNLGFNIQQVKSMNDMVGEVNSSLTGTIEAQNVQVGNTAVTATTGGGTTGLIPAKSSFVTVTSDNVNKQISLPAASVGDVIRIKVGATGCELISAVAAHQANGVVIGATNELALAANNLYICEYVEANKWIVRGFTAAGADLAALVPDAL